MKKIIFLFVCIFYYATSINAQQSIVESKDGESSLIFPNAGITFNTTDPKITVSYYYGVPRLNLYANDGRVRLNKDYSVADSVGIKRFRLIAGGAVSGKNEDGVAALFKDGEFTPGGEFSGLLGWTFNASKKLLKKSYSDYEDAVIARQKAVEKRNEFYNLLQDATSKLIEQIKGTSANLKTNMNTNGKKYDEEISKLCLAFVDGNEIPDKELALKAILEEFKNQKIWDDKEITSLGIRDKIQEILSLIPDLLDEDTIVNNKTVEINKFRLKNFNEDIDAFFSHSLIPFVSGKYMVKGFTQYLPDSIISKKFHDTTSSTGYLKFQLNYIYRKREKGSANIQYHMFGLGFGINWMDNYDGLGSVKIQEDKTVYKDSTTVGKSSKPKDAKSGAFYHFRNLSLDFDYLFIKNLDNYSLMVNPYIRSTFRYTSNEDSVITKLQDKNGDYRYRKGSLTFGMGLYFTAPKNIFIGGFFIEYAAVSLSQPPIDSFGKDNLTTKDRFKRNLFFGLVTKINFFKFRQDQLFTNAF